MNERNRAIYIRLLGDPASPSSWELFDAATHEKIDTVKAMCLTVTADNHTRAVLFHHAGVYEDVTVEPAPSSPDAAQAAPLCLECGGTGWYNGLSKREPCSRGCAQS